MSLVFLADEPVKDLELWFFSELRQAFGPEIYIILGYEGQGDFTPSQHIRISYNGYNSNESTTIIRQGFEFQIDYVSHLPKSENPHWAALQMLEKGRKTLWQKIAPRPANSGPLRLKSEKHTKGKKDCEILIYSQIWVSENEITRNTVTYADPCQGAGEPDSVIRLPLDYITPFDQNSYITRNLNYNANLPITEGPNQPWLLTAQNNWYRNPNYNANNITQWGNYPLIIQPYLKQLQVNFVSQPTTWG